MNFRKAYQMLIVVLFFAFISLISRSIIYLILSVAIATMIISLISNAKKTGRFQNKVVGEKNKADENIRLHKFLLITTIVGAFIIGYGSLYFKQDSIFHQLITVPTELYLAVIVIIAGFIIVLGSLYFIIVEMLSTTVEKKQQRNNHCQCGAKINSNHTFCPSCGQALK